MGTLVFYGSLPLFLAFLQPLDFFSRIALWLSFWLVFVHCVLPLEEAFCAWRDQSMPRLPALLRSNVVFPFLTSSPFLVLIYMRGSSHGLSAWLLVMSAARGLLFVWQKFYPPSSILDAEFSGDVQEILDAEPGLLLHDDNTDLSFLDKPITDEE
jgi:hypothetical protein